MDKCHTLIPSDLLLTRCPVKVKLSAKFVVRFENSLAPKKKTVSVSLYHLT